MQKRVGEANEIIEKIKHLNHAVKESQDQFSQLEIHSHNGNVFTRNKRVVDEVLEVTRSVIEKEIKRLEEELAKL